MRYNYVKTFNNDDELYKKDLIEKDKLFINQYESVKLRQLLESEYDAFDLKSHTWTQGDTLEKLSSLYYLNPRYWFLLAYFNNKPTEFHVANGDTIYIPMPLQKVLNFYNSKG